MRARSRIRASAVGVFAVASFLMCGAANAKGGGAIPVRIGMQAQTSWLLYEAKELKLFEKAGIAPTYIKFTYGALEIPAMQSHSLDIGSPGITPFVAGLAQGVDWKVIGLDTTLPMAQGFLAGKDTDIKTLEQFKGKRIAVTRGSTSYYGLLAALKKKGIGKDDVQLLLMGPAEQLPALLNKNIDGIAVWEPWIQRDIRQAGARLIGMEGDYGIHTACAIYAVDGEFAKNNPEGVKRFLRGLLMAYDYVEKHGPGVAIDAVANAMGIPKEWATAMYKEASAPDIRRWTDAGYQYSVAKHGPFAKESQEMADFLFEERVVPKKVDIRSAFDDSFVGAVLKGAGR